MSEIGHTFLSPQGLGFIVFGVIWLAASIHVGMAVRPANPVIDIAWILLVTLQCAAVLIGGAGLSIV